MPKAANSLSDAAKQTQAFLRVWRKSRKLTLEALAERTKYAVSTLSGWEKGAREVGTEDYHRLAAVYGVNPAALMLHPEEASPKIERMIRASGLAEQMTDEQAEHWLALAKSMVGDKTAG